MTDIVERLRSLKWLVHDEMRGLITDQSAYEAADEIEQLRAKVAELAEERSRLREGSMRDLAENAKLKELGDAMADSLDAMPFSVPKSYQAWKDYRNEQ